MAESKLKLAQHEVDEALKSVEDIETVIDDNN